jgi:ferric-dicitrate binding protein FerR (iron transport regulator)
MKNSPFDWEVLARYTVGDCSPEEAEAINGWRNANPDNELYFNKFKEVWLLSGDVPGHFKPDVAQAWEAVKAVTVSNPATAAATSKAHSPWLVYISGVAAVLLLGIFSWFRFFHGEQPNIPSSYLEKVTNSQRMQVQLADGSRVWLNTHSRFQYPEQFEGTTREVYLEGEAFFEVSPNRQKPFLIHTRHTVTKVLGTSFDIKAYEADTAITVSVHTGKVAFGREENQEKAVELRPGEQGIWLANVDQVSKRMADPNALAWHTRKLVFQETPVQVVTQTLGEFFQMQLHIENTAINQCRFTGTFKEAKLPEILEALKLTLGIDYSITGKTITIRGKGC